MSYGRKRAAQNRFIPMLYRPAKRVYFGAQKQFIGLKHIFYLDFGMFTGVTPYSSILQSLEPPTFSPHYALLLAQGKAVGDHGDEFGIGRLALDVPVSIAIACFFGSHIVY